MHEIHLTVVSPEEASDGVVEFWAGGRLIGSTYIDEGNPIRQSIHARTALRWC